MPQMLHEERLEEQRIQPGDSERMSPLSMAIVLLLALLALGPGVMGWCCWRGFPLRALLLTHEGDRLHRRRRVNRQNEGIC